MTLIRRSAAGLAALADRGSLAELMFAEMLHDAGLRPSPAEAGPGIAASRSWPET